MKKINLTKWIINNALIMLMAFSVMFVTGCEDDATPNPFEEDQFYAGDSDGQPVVTSMEPVGGALAGVSEVTLNGQNFLDTTERLKVYFGSVKAEIISASKTKLVVKAPNFVGDGLRVQVHTTHELHSEVVYYDLKPAVAIPYDFGEDLVPYSIAIDKDEYIYVSLTEFNTGVGVRKFIEGTVPSEWVPRGAGKETFWSTMRFDADGAMIAVRNNRAVYKFVEGVQPESAPWAKGFKDNLSSMDIDASGTVWASGGSSIYAIQSDLTNVRFEFEPKIQNIRVFEGYIYIAADNIIYRAKINGSDSLGDLEMVFDFASEFPLGNANCIDFAEDGTMYLGTDLKEPILIVHSDKTFEALYPAVVRQIEFDNPNDKNQITNFAWGNDNFLYAIYELTDAVKNSDGTVTSVITATVLKLDIQKKGSVTYGRD